MKVLIPIDHKDVNSAVCISFGRAPYFLIGDLKTGERRILENPGASSQGGAGIKAAQAVVDEKVEALLTPRMGKNAADVINLAGIKMFQTNGTSVDENIEAYKESALGALSEIHEGFHNHGGH